MYDALLDELDDDATSRPEEVIEDLAEDAAAGFDDTVDDLIHEVPDLVVALEEMELDVNVDGLLEGVDEDETWSDDPVRMYLTQMGEIPLLSRREEVTLARQIELHAGPLPPQGAGLRLRDAPGGEGPPPGTRRRLALRSDGAGLGDRPVGEGADSGPLAEQSADAGNADEAEPARLQPGHQPLAAAGRSGGWPGGGWAGGGAAPCG